MEIESVKKEANNTWPIRWTQTEIRELKRLYPMSHNKDLAKIFGRTRVSILRKAKKLGIKKDWGGGYRVGPPPQNENLWSREEVETLKNMFSNSSSRKIAEKLGRSYFAVQSKIRKLGLYQTLKASGQKRNFLENCWTAEEIALLKEFYPLKSRVQIAEQLGRSPDGVARMASKLKLSYLRSCPYRKNFWSAQDDAFLKEHIIIWPLEKIAEKLGRKSYTVQRRAWKKHFLKNCSNRHHTRQRLWTKQEIEQLECLLGRCSDSEIAARLSRSVQSVQSKLKQLGIKRPPFWSDRDIAILKKYFPFQTDRVVAQKLGKKPALVRIKGNELGLKKSIYAGYKQKH